MADIRAPIGASAGTMRVAMMMMTQEANQVTGTATYARALVRALSAAANLVDVEVIATARATRQLFPDWDVELPPVHRSRSRETQGLRRNLALARLALDPRRGRYLDKDSAEVAHYPLTLNIPRVSLPTVVTLHDLQHRDLPAYHSRTRRLWRRFLYDDAARAADHVITVSEHARGRAIELLGIAPARVHAIHHGLDHDAFRPVPGPSDGDIARELDLPERYLLYPAGLWPHKNHIRAISAFAAAGDRAAHLVLTGPTFGRLEEVIAHATRCGLGPRVRHLGFVPDGALPAVYRRARALIFPSLYEGFGAPLIEAMACGCPVAASDEGAIAEVCGNAAVTFDPRATPGMAEAFRTVLYDDHQRSLLRSKGLTRAREFSWSIAAAKHVAVYRHALAGRTL